MKSFVVPIIDDGVVEGTESINLSLTLPGEGGMEGSPLISTISILDDDKPLIVLEENTGRAAVLDSVWFLRDPFSLESLQNLSSDRRTRIMIFATGIELLPGESASAVLVQLEDSQNHVYPLVVEDVRKVPNFDFSQIVVRLSDSIQTEGDFRITLTFRGTTSNKPPIGIVR